MFAGPPAVWNGLFREFEEEAGLAEVVLPKFAEVVPGIVRLKRGDVFFGLQLGINPCLLSPFLVGGPESVVFCFCFEPSK